MLEQELNERHSVRGYLNRRDTETLMQLLQFYLQQEISAYHGELIQIILEILVSREDGDVSIHTAEALSLYEQMYSQ